VATVSSLSGAHLTSTVAPFVGHNAFLRWSALQECAEVDDYDGEKRVWSERHVSEDFQVALNLQTAVSCPADSKYEDVASAGVVRGRPWRKS
jgi:hypothetical protein